jgi:tetratricopeptide (TPR) repeat protein
MASPAFPLLSKASRLCLRGRPVIVALISVALSGCSIELGSLTSSSSPDQDPAKLTSPSNNIASLSEAIKKNPDDPQAHSMRGTALAQAGKTDEALADFNKAIELAPDNAEAYYNRGLLYQGEKQDQSAIDDFTKANRLIPQRADPLLARAQSYLATDRPREASADLDEAVRDDPQNAQAWLTRGLAYERLGDKNRAAGCYSRAIDLRPKDEVARNGFARVGGRPGQNYDTF